MAELMEKVEDYVSSSTISHETLMDKLSEFLAVERGGIKLYQMALQVVRDPEVSKKFREFYEQTRKHETILLRVIGELGGNPEHMSAGAKLAEEKGKALLKTMADTDGMTSRGAEINAIENIILAETKDHADWEMLGKVARRSDNENIRKVLKPAVSEVEPEEDEHLNWTKKQMARLEFESLIQ